MADELPDTGRLRKQLEYYESEVRRLEQQLAQTNLGFNKQVADLEQKVKELSEQLETNTKEQPEKIVDADKHLTEESNHAFIINSKDQMIAVLEAENQKLKTELHRQEQIPTERVNVGIDLTNVKRICYEIRSMYDPLKKKLQFYHPLFDRMSREEPDDKFFTYDIIIDDFEEEGALKILKALQENAPESYILKEKLFRSELPFTGRSNLTLEESKKIKNNLSAIDGTQVTIKRSDQLEGGQINRKTEILGCMSLLELINTC